MQCEVCCARQVNDAEPPVVYIPMTTFAASSATGDATNYFTGYEWGWMNVLVRRRDAVTMPVRPLLRQWWWHNW